MFNKLLLLVSVSVSVSVALWYSMIWIYGRCGHGLNIFIQKRRNLLKRLPISTVMRSGLKWFYAMKTIKGNNFKRQCNSNYTTLINEKCWQEKLQAEFAVRVKPMEVTN